MEAASLSELVPLLTARHAGPDGRTGQDALLPILHDLVEELGHVPDEAVAPLAQALNISRADVHGVISFYPDFNTRPHGRHLVRICRAESCQARGGKEAEAALERRLGVSTGETRPDGQVTLEAVYCLGLCAIGPNALVDGKPVARIDSAGIERIADMVTA